MTFINTAFSSKYQLRKNNPSKMANNLSFGKTKDLSSDDTNSQLKERCNLFFDNLDYEETLAIGRFLFDQKPKYLDKFNNLTSSESESIRQIVCKARENIAQLPYMERKKLKEMVFDRSWPQDEGNINLRLFNIAKSVENLNNVTPFFAKGSAMKLYNEAVDRYVTVDNKKMVNFQVGVAALAFAFPPNN